MARGKKTQDSTILQMALIGYEVEKQKIEEKIREIKAQLGGARSAGVSVASAAKAAAPKKRRLSPEARKRIAAAQKKRWAEHRKKKAAQSAE